MPQHPSVPLFAKTTLGTYNNSNGWACFHFGSKNDEFCPIPQIDIHHLGAFWEDFCPEGICTRISQFRKMVE